MGFSENDPALGDKVPPRPVEALGATLLGQLGEFVGTTRSALSRSSSLGAGAAAGVYLGRSTSAGGKVRYARWGKMLVLRTFLRKMTHEALVRVEPHALRSSTG